MWSSAARPVRWSWMAAAIALSLSCQQTTTPLPNDPDARIPLKSRPVWQNWSQNLVHEPSRSGEYYYFAPTNVDELRTIVRQAQQAGVELRVSGQRHSQPPLVADDNRPEQPYHAKGWLIDLSCYADLGKDGKQQIELDARNKQVRVNAGVREDYLDAFLTRNDLMLQTVTAGGFFSVGGTTAVDVHGATTAAPIIAETVSQFTIMGPDGRKTQIDSSYPAGKGWNAIQFARVSLGALGIVTSVTFDVGERRWATTLRSGRDHYTLADEDAFVAQYKEILKHDRVESFYDPYTHGFDVLWWDVVPSPAEKIPNPDREVASSCTYAQSLMYGSPYESEINEWLAQGTEGWAQLYGTRSDAQAMTNVALGEVRRLFDASRKTYSDLWLTKAARVAFMSYFVELPELDDDGLRKVWQALNVVATELDHFKYYRVAAPLEFRFVRGGNSALSGTYTEGRDRTFVNLDLISFVPPKPAIEYPPQMLRFFADVEREWYGTFQGLPHNGKMYGFYDPNASPGSSEPPFSPAFLRDLAARRGARMQAFEAFRRQRDPNGLFCNDYLRAASLCASNPSR